MVKHLLTVAGARDVTHLASLTTTRACTVTNALVYVDAQGKQTTFTPERPGIVAREQFAGWESEWARRSMFAQFG